MTSQPEAAAAEKSGRAWWVVAGLFGVLLTSSGFGFYNLSVYVNVFATELGESASQSSVLASLFFVTGGMAGVWVARLLERAPLKPLMLTGALVSGSALALTGLADTLWQVWLLFAIFGIGNAAVSIVVSTTLIAQWFPGSNRSLALSIASTGLSVGGVVITPVSAWALEQMGVASVMPWIGAGFVLCTVPLILWLVETPPGFGPGNVRTEEADVRERYARVVRSPFFLLHTAAYILLMGVQVGGIAHLYSRAEELAGFATAAFCVQTLSGTSIMARFAGGWLLMRVSAFGFTLFNLALQSVGLLLIGLADDATSMILGAVVFGSSVGNLLMLQPLQLAETFGPDVLARLFALANALTLIGVGTGPFLLGYLYDLYDYDVSYFASGAISATAFAILCFARPGRV